MRGIILGDAKHFFFFFLFSFGLGEILEKECPQDHQTDNVYSSWGESSQIELIQDYPCVS